MRIQIGLSKEKINYIIDSESGNGTFDKRKFIEAVARAVSENNKEIQNMFDDLPRHALQHSENDPNELFKAIDQLIEQKIKKLEFDKTETVRIIAINENGSYKVSYSNAGVRTLKTNEERKCEWINEEGTDIVAVDNTLYKVGDIVLIEIPNGDNSLKYIKCKRPE